MRKSKLFIFIIIFLLLSKQNIVFTREKEACFSPPSSLNEKEKNPPVLLTSPLPSRPSQICFLPSPKIVVSTVNGEILIYNLKTSLMEFKKRFSSFPISTLSLLSENHLIIFGDKGGVIKFFDFVKKRVIEKIYEPGRIISKITVSPDKSVLVVGDFSGKLTFYTIKDCQLLKSITFLPPRRITSLSFSKDNSLLGITFKDKRIGILPIGSKRATILPLSSFATTCDWYKNEFLAVGEIDGKLSVYQLLPPFRQRVFFQYKLKDWITSVRFFFHYLLTGCKDGKIRIFDLKNKRLVNTITVGKPILDMAVEKRRKLLGVATPEKLFVYEIEKILLEER